MDITIVDYFGYPLPGRERIRLIRDAGFSGIAGILWTDAFDGDYAKFPEYADSAGLYVENMHAAWDRAGDLWDDGIDGQSFLEEILENIAVCAERGIPALVMHPESKRGTEYAPLPDSFDIGIDRRFWQIAEAAERLGVNVAVENVASAEYLARIFERINSARLGFCFDSGHHNLFTRDTDLIALYGSRLMALHLHDNDGANDDHALPFSGVIDWRETKTKLAQTGYKGAIALEVGNKNFEHIADPAEFLSIAAQRAREIAYF